MEFPVTSDGIRRALDALLVAADAAAVPRAVAHRMAVIADEYCSNLIRHDPTVTDQSLFWLTVEPIDGGAALVIRDQAQAFDPTTHRIVARNGIGGQGIGLMRGLASRLAYVAGPDGNELRAVVLDDAKSRDRD